MGGDHKDIERTGATGGGVAGLPTIVGTPNQYDTLVYDGTNLVWVPSGDNVLLALFGSAPTTYTLLGNDYFGLNTSTNEASDLLDDPFGISGYVETANTSIIKDFVLNYRDPVATGSSIGIFKMTRANAPAVDTGLRFFFTYDLNTQISLNSSVSLNKGEYLIFKNTTDTDPADLDIGWITVHARRIPLT